jgi:hypothetical protein
MHSVYYTVVDFNGELQWLRRADGSYLVDPRYLNEFLHLSFILKFCVVQRPGSLLEVS